MDILAGIEIDSIIWALLGGAATALGWFLNRTFSANDQASAKVEARLNGIDERITELERRISDRFADLERSTAVGSALVNQELGQMKSSDRKQWDTIDVAMRELSEMKIRLADIRQRPA